MTRAALHRTAVSFASGLACGLIAALIVQLSNPAHAADFHSPRTVGLGNAGRAGPFINDAIYLNPSLVPLLLRVRSLSANYQPHHSAAGVQGRVANVSFQDGTAPLFEAGVGYTLRDDGPILSVGASKSFFERTGFGLGYKLFIRDSDGGTKPSGSDALFSFTYIPFNWLTLALTVDNLFDSRAATSRRAYREFSLASKINVMSIVLLYFDPRWTPTFPNDESFGYDLGIEFPIFSDLFLRLGKFKKSYIPFLADRTDGYGAGIGWIGPKISLDYGLQRVVGSNGIPSATAHTFGTTIFF